MPGVWIAAAAALLLLVFAGCVTKLAVQAFEAKESYRRDLVTQMTDRRLSLIYGDPAGTGTELWHVVNASHVILAEHRRWELAVDEALRKPH